MHFTTSIDRSRTMSSSLVNKTILFLEGPAAPLWRELADAFDARGARWLHVRLSLGDRSYTTPGEYVMQS